MAAAGSPAGTRNTSLASPELPSSQSRGPAPRWAPLTCGNRVGLTPGAQRPAGSRMCHVPSASGRAASTSATGEGLLAGRAPPAAQQDGSRKGTAPEPSPAHRTRHAASDRAVKQDVVLAAADPPPQQHDMPVPAQHPAAARTQSLLRSVLEPLTESATGLGQSEEQQLHTAGSHSARKGAGCGQGAWAVPIPGTCGGDPQQPRCHPVLAARGDWLSPAPAECWEPPGPGDRFLCGARRGQSELGRAARWDHPPPRPQRSFLVGPRAAAAWTDALRTEPFRPGAHAAPRRCRACRGPESCRRPPASLLPGPSAAPSALQSPRPLPAASPRGSAAVGAGALRQRRRPRGGAGLAPERGPSAGRCRWARAASPAPPAPPRTRPVHFRGGSKGGGGPVRIHHARLAPRARAAPACRSARPECHVRGQRAAPGSGAGQWRARRRQTGQWRRGAARARGPAANPRRRRAGSRPSRRPIEAERRRGRRG